MSTRAAAVAVAGAAVALYWRALSSGFVGDDFMILHRLRGLSGPFDALRFFRGEFFEYYRPLGFVAHAADWAIGGADPRQFHLTNVLLHAVCCILVLLIGRELSPRSTAGPLAALLFALHASNHEAVVWISARFDLLATLFSLAALWWMLRTGAGWSVVPVLLFGCAILSKESSVALPLAAAGFAVFHLKAPPAAVLRRTAPWIAALAIYSVLRHVAGGVSAIGGATRIPKLVVFIGLFGGIALLAGDRWEQLKMWLLGRRRSVLAAMLAVIALAAATAAAGGRAGDAVAEKLAVAGFAIFHLGSPILDSSGMPFYLDPGTRMYWLGGALALAAAAVLLALVWRRVVDDDRMWFLATLLIASLLPISALTEGARYLYFPSAALSLIVGLLVAESGGRARASLIGAMVVFLALSTWQIAVKLRDWEWAGRMTAEGARLVDASLAPSCGTGRVVFLTEPVAIRSVYTHFLYETFEPVRGCMPETFQILVRVLRIDTVVNARWDGPARIVISAPAYRGNFSLSSDLRHFQPPLHGPDPVTLQTPLGELHASRDGDAEQLTLTLAPGVDAANIGWFYYSDGAIRRLAPPR